MKRSLSFILFLGSVLFAYGQKEKNLGNEADKNGVITPQGKYVALADKPNMKIPRNTSLSFSPSKV